MTARTETRAGGFSYGAKNRGLPAQPRDSER